MLAPAPVPRKVPDPVPDPVLAKALTPAPVEKDKIEAPET
jgi:hypothetical protein